MEKSKSLLLPFLSLTLAVSSFPLTAADYEPYDPGSRAPALGGAFVARADDVTALFANPAGLAFLKGLRFKTNFFGGKPALSAVQPAGGSTFRSDPLHFSGSFAASWQFLDKITAGVGFYIPYHFSTIWPSTWPGDRISSKASLNSIVIRPAVAVELMDGLALGVGLDLVRAKASWNHILTFNMEKYPLPQDATVGSQYQVSGSGTGFTAGILWKAHPMVRCGAKYQHRAGVDLSGKNVFLIGWDDDYVILPDPAQRQRRLRDLLLVFYSGQPVASRWTFPREIVCGVAFIPSARWSFELDLQWNGWSEMGVWEFKSLNPEDRLSPAFTPELQEFYGIKPDYGRQGAGLVLKDSWRVKAGLEVAPAAGFAVRAGFARHPSPAAEADLNPVHPCLDRDVVSLGFGYEGAFFSMGSDNKLGEISFDVFFQYGFSKKGVSAVPGIEFAYQDKPWNVGVGVGAIF